MKNVSIFTPEIRVLCQRSFTEPLRNFTPRLEENEKAREKALKKERTLFFFSSSHDCAAEDTFYHRSGLALWKIQISEEGKKRVGHHSLQL